jgi:hypothetical protein
MFDRKCPVHNRLDRAQLGPHGEDKGAGRLRGCG